MKQRGGKKKWKKVPKKIDVAPASETDIKTPNEIKSCKVCIVKQKLSKKLFSRFVYLFNLLQI